MKSSYWVHLALKMKILHGLLVTGGGGKAEAASFKIYKM